MVKNDNWTIWRVSRPFSDEEGAAEWLHGRLADMESSGFNTHTAVQVMHDQSGNPAPGSAAPPRFDAATVRSEYRRRMAELQARVGETVIIDFSFTGFCDIFDSLGLEIFTFFSGLPASDRIHGDLHEERDQARGGSG